MLDWICAGCFFLKIFYSDRITPIYSLIFALLTDKARHSAEIRLLYSNKTGKDVLLRQELEELADKHPDRFHMCHVITTPSPDDDRFREDRVLFGRVNRRMAEEFLFPPALDSAALVCGPPGMMETVMAALEKTGFTQNALLEF